jgi:hypothetical protein
MAVRLYRGGLNVIFKNAKKYDQVKKYLNNIDFIAGMGLSKFIKFTKMPNEINHVPLKFPNEITDDLIKITERFVKPKC